VSLERYERGDLEPMFTDFYADDLRWDLTNFDPWPDAEVYVGEDQVREVYKLWFGTWAELHFTVESFDAPPDKASRWWTNTGPAVRAAPSSTCGSASSGLCAMAGPRGWTCTPTPRMPSRPRA
jgi:hypothetical protein